MTHGKNMVVIGAGPAGLCVGWNLAADGHAVTVLEKDAEIGGLSCTIEDHGFHLDLGPHNIHTRYSIVLTFLRKLLGDDLVEHYPRVKVLFRGRMVDYPLKGLRAFFSLPVVKMPAALVTFVIARALMFARNPKHDNTFEAWIKHRFGTTLYHAYFGPYAEKAWKIPPSELSSYVAEKRVPLFSIGDYIRHIFRAPPKLQHGEDWTNARHLYARLGIGQITSNLASRIGQAGGGIETRTRITGIEGKDRRVTAVEFETPEGQRRIPVDFLFSTIPINELIAALRLPVPDNVRQAAAGLDYCAMTLLYIKVTRENVFDVPIVYFSDPDVKFNRVYDVGHFSRKCVPAGKTALCVEFTCNQNDDVWTMSDTELRDEVMTVLERNRLLSPQDVEGCLVRRITHGYPRFRLGFYQRVETILEYLSGLENVITLGRQGLFCYANVDDALYMGFRAAEMMNTVQKVGVDYHDLFPRYVNL